VVQEGDTILVQRANESRLARERHGLCRTLVANMVEGVANGYQKRLEIQGIGYRAQVQGKNLNMSLGYSHPVVFEPPEGIEFAVENNTNVIVSGIDKELVGNMAARIRASRPPEPYKGKGVRYAGEYIRRKAGKAGKK
jgi:large subunit ribosomal protein L6